MTRQSDVERLMTQFLDAWNSQDVDRVVGCYTEDMCYRDPNTRGPVEGREAMRRYLAKLFAGWQMTWRCRQVFALEQEGVALLWHATFRRASGGPTVETDGMDLVLLRGDLACRNEVYFDRGALASLME